VLLVVVGLVGLTNPKLIYILFTCGLTPCYNDIQRNC